MRPRPTHTSSLLKFGWLLFAVLGGLAGCSRTSPMEPAPAPASRLDAPSPAGVLQAPDQAVGASHSTRSNYTGSNSENPPDPDPGDWECVGSSWIGENETGSVAAGRYKLHVEKGCVDTATAFTIAVYDTSVLDVELGPHGDSFGQPVQLFIRYSGTQADPASPDYNGRVPEIVWYDEASGTWVVVPSEIDEVRLTISAELTHFSRYSVRGKASW